MKLSENTYTVLKNFATINSGLLLRKGKIQKTVSVQDNIFVEAEIEDEIPNDFGIYDLNTFLGNASTLKNPEMEFTSEAVLMNDGEITMNFYSCPSYGIVSPDPKTKIVVDKSDLRFDLNNATFQKMMRLASMNGLPNITVIGKNGEVRLQAHEVSNDTSNFVYLKLYDYDGADFSATFSVENLKLLPDDYEVEIVLDGYALFKSKTKNVKYFIALELTKKRKGI